MGTKAGVAEQPQQSPSSWWNFWSNGVFSSTSGGSTTSTASSKSWWSSWPTWGKSSKVGGRPLLIDKPLPPPIKPKKGPAAAISKKVKVKEPAAATSAKGQVSAKTNGASKDRPQGSGQPGGVSKDRPQSLLTASKLETLTSVEFSPFASDFILDPSNLGYGAPLSKSGSLSGVESLSRAESTSSLSSKGSNAGPLSKDYSIKSESSDGWETVERKKKLFANAPKGDQKEPPKPPQPKQAVPAGESAAIKKPKEIIGLPKGKEIWQCKGLDGVTHFIPLGGVKGVLGVLNNGVSRGTFQPRVFSQYGLNALNPACHEKIVNHVSVAYTSVKGVGRGDAMRVFFVDDQITGKRTFCGVMQHIENTGSKTLPAGMSPNGYISCE